MNWWAQYWFLGDWYSANWFNQPEEVTPPDTECNDGWYGNQWFQNHWFGTNWFHGECEPEVVETLQVTTSGNRANRIVPRVRPLHTEDEGELIVLDII